MIRVSAVRVGTLLQKVLHHWGLATGAGVHEGCPLVIGPRRAAVKVVDGGGALMKLCVDGGAALLPNITHTLIKFNNIPIVYVICVE